MSSRESWAPRVLVPCETLRLHFRFPLNELELKLEVCPMKFPSVLGNESVGTTAPGFSLSRFSSSLSMWGWSSPLCGRRKVKVT